MRAIIINDNDARSLLDQLKLEFFSFNLSGAIVDRVSAADVEQVKRDVHGRFHYVVTRWLQEQGASIIR